MAAARRAPKSSKKVSRNVDVELVFGLAKIIDLLVRICKRTTIYCSIVYCAEPDEIGLFVLSTL